MTENRSKLPRRVPARFVGGSVTFPVRRGTIPSRDDLPPRKGVGIMPVEKSGGSGHDWEPSADMTPFFPNGQPGKKAPRFTQWNHWVDIFKANAYISSGVRMIGESMMSGGLKVVPISDGAKVSARSQKILGNFLDTFHPYYTLNEFFRAEAENLVLSGRCYIEVCLNKLKQPAAMYDLPQGTIIPQPKKNGLFEMGADKRGLTGTAFIQVLPDRDDPIQFPWSRILWLRMPGIRSNSLNPMSPVELLTLPASTLIESEKYIHSFYRTGGKMGLVLENKGWTKEKAIEARKYYERYYTESSNGHRMLMLYDGTTLADTPKQVNQWAQLLDVTKIDGRKVSAVLNINPILLGFESGAKLGGNEEEKVLEQFHIANVNPKKETISDQITNQIVVQLFQIDDARLELTPFKSKKDATSMNMLATTYKTMNDLKAYLPKRLADVNRARTMIDDGLEPLTQEELDKEIADAEAAAAALMPAPAGPGGPGGGPPKAPAPGGPKAPPKPPPADKGGRSETLDEERYNPHHSADGKFSAADGAAMHVPKGGKASWKATAGAEALGPGGGRTGLAAKVTTAAGGSIPSRYVLMSASEVHASHLERSGAPNPEYPHGVQNREFNNNVVSDIARNLSADAVLDPGYSAEAGPTVVTEHEGKIVAVGGNHRLMGLQRSERENPAAFEKYQAQLKEDAVRYGIDPASVRPGDILVRQIAHPGDAAKIERLGRDMNESRVTDYDQKGDAVTHGQNLSESTKGIISRQFDAEVEASGDKASLASMLSKPDSQKILHAMIKDGSIPKGKLNTYIAKDGTFTTAGKTAVTAALVGHVINDADTIRELPAKAFENIAASVPHLVRAESSAGALGAIGKIRQAAALVVAAKGVAIDQHLEQLHFQEGSKEGVKLPHPGHEVVTLANKMRQPGSRKFAAYVKGTVKAASAPVGIFGGSEHAAFRMEPAKLPRLYLFALLERRAREVAVAVDDDQEDEDGMRSNPHHGDDGRFSSDGNAIETVRAGSGTFLGHGDDGKVFAVGNHVVKVSDVYSPRRGMFRPAEFAARELVRQGELNNELAKAGIPGIMPVRIHERAGQAFLVREKLDMPDRLSAIHLDQVRQSIDAMHDAGWAVGDDIQVGIGSDGKAYQYDLGKAFRARDHTDKEQDSDNFERLSNAMGHAPLPLRSTAERFLSELSDRTALMDPAEASDFEKKLRAGLAASAMVAARRTAPFAPVMLAPMPDEVSAAVRGCERALDEIAHQANRSPVDLLLERCGPGLRMNPNHDAKGLFSSGSGGGGGKVPASSGRPTGESSGTAAAVAQLGAKDEPTTPPPPGKVYNPDPAEGKAARVGVPGDQVPPPPAEIPRLPNLTPEERAVEHSFASAYEKNPDGMAADVIKALADRKIGDAPNVFGTDDVKALFASWAGTKEIGADGKATLSQETKDFRSLYNTSLHQTANALAKRAFVKYLDDVVSKLPEGERNVLVTAGGVAAGKGYAISQVESVNSMAKVASVVWDTAGEQNSTELSWVAKEAGARGIKMTAVYVHADPASVWENPDRGVMQRAAKIGRMVDARLFADSYTHGARNFAAFQEKHADNPNVSVAILDNSKGAVPVRLDKMPEHVLKADPEELYAKSVNALARTNVPDTVKRGGSSGTRIWGPPKA